eukprot:2602743-Pyramimonas_sp.AAC.2
MSGLCRWRHQGAVKKQLCGGHHLGLRVFVVRGPSLSAWQTPLREERLVRKLVTVAVAIAKNIRALTWVAALAELGRELVASFGLLPFCFTSP